MSSRVTRWTRLERDRRRPTPCEWRDGVPGIRVPQALAHGHQARGGIDRHDLERKPGLVIRRERALHRRVDTERVEDDTVAWTDPVVELIPVGVAVKVGGHVGMPREERFERSLL